MARLNRERAAQDPSMDREPTLHFVEDRVETLEKVCGDPRLQNVQLYLADWGYTTDAARERAMLNPRIRILQLADFACMCQALGAREGEAGEEGR
ncbi:uncharacterized protein Naga_100379g1 [Nannochloropsis gaditana]|uniref:Uncharacterized protein n=1 Tax=Nannochloropsis gaditana TaxID=72520 RepID=W7UAP2_9STRA|nr:uncharacterized protein Naga_100379g1 [Nannochloropsis gaditana]